MNQNKIAFLIPSLGSGGAERVVSTLSNGLLKSFEIVIITLAKSSAFYSLNSKIKVIHCVEKVRPSSNVIEAVSSNWKLFKVLSKIIEEEEIKLIISFMTTSNVLAILASKSKDIRVIISERNNPVVAQTPIIWKFLRGVLYGMSDSIVVQTQGIKDYYRHRLKEKKIVILPNPISHDLTALRRFPHNRDKVILSVGSLTEQKAQDTLIRMFAEINPEGWELHIVGKGEKETEYRRLIKLLEIENKVRILPPTTHIEHHYNRGSIFAFTSIFEGSPNALIEAMHFGMACISTDCPTGPAELIRDGINGFLIPLYNTEMYKKKLFSLILNQDLRKEFGSAAAESMKQFEGEKVIRQWSELIERELKGV